MAILLLPGPARAQAPTPSEAPRVTVALLPQGIGIESLNRADGLAVGLMSAGIGQVSAPQTFLDITQGNRVSESLYDAQLPIVLFDDEGVRPERWAEIEARAADAPADIVPGLLAEALEDAGVAAEASVTSGVASLIAADTAGRIARGRAQGGGLAVVNAEAADLERLADGLEGDDLLIAFERPPPEFRTLTLAIAGEGFSGRLTSDSTRTEGLVTATDVAPTVLDRLGVEVPSEMNGQPIRSEGGDPDLAGLAELRDRLGVTGQRRGPVVGQTLLIWLALAAAASFAFRGRGARAAVALLALAAAYMPLLMLLTAALGDPSLLAERLIVTLGAPLAALVTWRLWPGWRALAVACLVTVVAYAVDVLAGSVLIPVSIPGPNPASGSRFYGIGNEIEAVMGALLPLGVGAALAARASTRDGGPAAAAIFLATGLAAAAAFALGRFGADVGAAIVLPAAAAAAAAVALGTRRGVLLAVLVPIGCVVALMAADLLLGGGAHLTRSVLDAGGLEEAGNVFERRIRLAAASFTRGANIPFMVLTVIAIGAGVHYRERIRSWYPERVAFAGFIGALVAAAIGTVSNDSGVTLLILGTAYAAAGAGYAWSRTRPPPRDGPRPLT